MASNGHRGPDRASDGKFAQKMERQSNGQFKNGVPRPPNAGRKKGTPNKTTRAVKEFLAALCDEERVQRAVRRRIIKGDTIAFFRALDHVVGKPVETVNANIEAHVYEWGKR